MSVNHRFGDARSRQTKRQKHRVSELGSGKRGKDPAIHATSRPWHTSTPGIRMNVTTLGQIAAKDKVAARYLNKMNLSEMAQKKRGIAESEQGRGYDKMGMAMARGLKHSVKTQRGMGSPNQDRIDMWQASITGRIASAERPGADLSTMRSPAVVADPARGVKAQRASGQTVTHAEMVAKLKGIKTKLPKRPYHHSGGHNSYST